MVEDMNALTINDSCNPERKAPFHNTLNGGIDICKYLKGKCLSDMNSTYYMEEEMRSRRFLQLGLKSPPYEGQRTGGQLKEG